jgi:HEAT repeat protein
MDIHQIEVDLDREDFQYRLAAVKALKDYDAQIAVPLLTSKRNDPEFLVRTFVCMGLGKQQTAESYAALLEILKLDNTPNVRAEAANSLSLFGKCAAAQLVMTFFKDDHWLVRRSILAALLDLDCQHEVVEVCQEALKGDDVAVREAAISALGDLTAPAAQTAALSLLLPLVEAEFDRTRQQVAYALKKFDTPVSKAALQQLRQDSNHRVVAAALEDLL